MLGMPCLGCSLERPVDNQCLTGQSLGKASTSDTDTPKPPHRSSTPVPCSVIARLGMQLEISCVLSEMQQVASSNSSTHALCCATGLSTVTSFVAASGASGCTTFKVLCVSGFLLLTCPASILPRTCRDATAARPCLESAAWHQEHQGMH